MNLKTLAISTILATTLATGGAMAANPKSKAVRDAAISLQSATQHSGDTAAFVTKASVANLFEIKSSQLALEKSKNGDVRSFAHQMISDHTKAGASMKAAIAKLEAAPASPKDLDANHKQQLQALKKLSGKDFDTAYIELQRNAHHEAVDLFGDYALNGDDAPLKDFAAKTLPTLKAHQSHIIAIDEKFE